jgi:hypothetical protein
MQKRLIIWLPAVAILAFAALAAAAQQPVQPQLPPVEQR